MAQTKITLLDGISYIISRSCWTKLFSHDNNDKKRLQSIERAAKASATQILKIRELAERTANQQLLALLEEQFDFDDHK